jgi:lipoprotein-releasing system permease protein
LFALRIAIRFLTSKKADVDSSHTHFLSFVTLVSIIGVCVGVLALLVVTSVVNGFEKELTSIISGTQGDIIFYSRGSPIRDRDSLERKLREFTPHFEAITGSFVGEVMLHGPYGVSGGIIEGVDPATWGSVTAVDRHLEPGGVFPTEEGQIVLGATLAEKLGVKKGDTVRVILPFTGNEEEGVSGDPRVQDFLITGLLHLGMHDYDSKYAYALLPAVQKLVLGEEAALKNQLTSFRIKLTDSQLAMAAAAELSKHFGFPYRIKDWSQLNRNLLYAIQLEKGVIAALLTAIMIVAAFNVISALLMMVYEKEKEITILRVLGMKKRDQFILFSWVGSFFGMMGTLSGVVLGLVCVLVLSKTHLISLPAEVYHLEYLPVVIRFTEWCAIALMAFVICFLATVFPAAKIAKRSPVEGLKWTA